MINWKELSLFLLTGLGLICFWTGLITLVLIGGWYILIALPEYGVAFKGFLATIIGGVVTLIMKGYGDE